MMRNHCMNGYLKAFADAGVPIEGINAIKDGFDINVYVFGNSVPLGAMYGILLGTCAVLLVVYIAIVVLQSKNISFKMLKKNSK